MLLRYNITLRFSIYSCEHNYRPFWTLDLELGLNGLKASTTTTTTGPGGERAKKQRPRGKKGRGEATFVFKSDLAKLGNLTRDEFKRV